MKLKGLSLIAMLLMGLVGPAGAAEELKAPAGSPATKLKSSEEPTGAEAIISRLEFREAKMVDVIRALADMSGLNIVATKEAGGKDVTVFLQNISVKDALDTISKTAGLWYRLDRSSNTYRIMTTDEYQKDVVVYREDTTRVFNLLHPNPVIVASAIRDLYGNRVILSLGMEADDFGTGSGIGGGRGGYGSGYGGYGGYGSSYGSNYGVSRANQARAGQASLRRSTGSSSYYNDRRLNRSINSLGRRGGIGSISENLVDEQLTADQLAKIGAMTDGEGGTVSSEALEGITRTEQPIYITVNREHNLIIVRTSDASAVKEIERLVKEMDRPTPQVLLEMKILELSVGDSFSQTFSLGTISNDGKHTLNLGNAISSETGSLIYTFIDERISARLELLERNNRINTLSSPILLASNNRPARVFVGEERVLVTGVSVTDPVIDSGIVISPGRVSYETEIRDIGNTLNIIPKINADRTVTLSIQQDSSTVLEGAVTLPPITIGNSTQSFTIDSVKTANVEGIVVAKDGLTVAIGGLISSSTSNNVRKVPLLGDIPLVGELFKNKEQSTTKSELVLLITPRIITNPSEGEGVSWETVAPLSSREVDE
jgi:general secretion pathway protein D